MKVAGMSKPKFLTSRFIDCALRYAVYFLCVAVTPFLAKPISPLFDWAGYGLMRPLFVEIFTIIFWGLEWLAIHLVEKRRRKKNEVEELPKKKRQINPPIPFKNLVTIMLLCVATIFAVSVAIDFKVKPIYDIGEKVTGYEIWNAVGMLGRNVFKCFWLLGMVLSCKGMADEVISSSEKLCGKKYLAWILAGAVLMVFGVFDILTSVVSFPLTKTEGFLALAYLLVYGTIAAVCALTENSRVKAFLLIVLVYMF